MEQVADRGRAAQVAAGGVTMTGHDIMLGWVSGRRRGTLEHFREAWTWVFRDRDPKWWRRSLEGLQALGHVEVHDNRWEVAAPTVTTLADGGGYALLCGARPPSLVRTLRVGPHGVELAQSVPQRDGPSLQLIAYDSEDQLVAVCADLGINFEQRVADRLLALAPTLNDILIARRVDDGMPGGTLLSVLGKDLSFSDEGESRGTLPGAYRHELFRQRRYFYRHGEPPNPLFEAGLQEVRYAEMRRLHAEQYGSFAKPRHLEWDEKSRQLLLGPRQRLPLMYERATVLRSGLLPSWNERRRQWVYCNVDEDFRIVLTEKLAA